MGGLHTEHPQELTVIKKLEEEMKKITKNSNETKALILKIPKESDQF